MDDLFWRKTKLQIHIWMQAASSLAFIYYGFDIMQIKWTEISMCMFLFRKHLVLSAIESWLNLKDLKMHVHDRGVWY